MEILAAKGSFVGTKVALDKMTGGMYYYDCRRDASIVVN
jgi:hypothetical protein